MKHQAAIHRTLRTLFAGACAALLTGTTFAEREYLAWGQRYDVAQNSTQRGVAIATDRRGNVAMTGYKDVSPDSWYTVKYDALTGAIVWEVPFSNGVGDDRPAAIATDSAGNVIVTGYSTSADNHDYFTIKYSASTGAVLWSKRYNNSPQDGADEAVGLVVDGSDNVIVTGRSIGNGTQDDIHTIKYSGTNGTELWNRRYNSAGNFSDVPRSIALAPNGDVVITGFSRVGSDPCYYTAKYAAATGNVIWDETYDNFFENDNDVATDVACDSAGNAVVTGYSRKNNGDYVYYTRKYASANGATVWSRAYTAPGGNSLLPAFIGVDPADNVIISGTARLDGFKVAFYTAKYASATGAILWERTSVPPGSAANDFVDDDVKDMVVDGAGNVIVTGSSRSDETGDDYFTVKYDNDGELLWVERLNGDQDSGTDSAAAVAVDPGGNVAVTGNAKKASPSPYFEIITVKYNRFLLSVGDSVKGPGLTDAVVSSLGVPAVGDNGPIAVRIGIKDGKKRFSGILGQTSAGGNTITAMTGQPAPDVANAEFKSFNDPVIAPNGRFAFIAKISGVPGSQSTGVWTNAFNGSLQLALQVGKEVPGLGTGVLLKSVKSISLRNGNLAALIEVKGSGVTGANKSVLVGLSSPNSGLKLLRTGDPITADTVASTIKKLSIYTPPKTSPGHGRYHGDSRLVASASLADKRTAFLIVSTTGIVAPALTSEGDAANVAAGAKWKSFGPPAIASNGFNYATLAALQQKVGGVTGGDDSVIVTSSTGASFDDLARENGAAPGAGGATFSGFTDPVTSFVQKYAFLGTLKGQGVNGGNKNGLWFGTPGNLALVARTDDFAPDGAGNASASKFTGFKNLALPTTGPIFLASVKGTGVNKKNNTGLWGVDSEGFLRQLIRNGDTLGDFTVKNFTLLNSTPGTIGTTRSFNNTGGVTALVNFTDKSSALIFVGIP